MNDDRLYDLFHDLDDAVEYDVYGRTVEQRTALLQVRAIATLAEQVGQLGRQIEQFVELAEEFITPEPSRWQRIRGRLS